MPVEIKELHIKAIVGNRVEIKETGLKKEDVARLKKEITKEVIEKVFKLIKQKNER
jgi:hypothetical protein